MTASVKLQDNSKNNALIIFTREPEPGKTKTRLMPYFSPEQCAGLHRCMIKDISKEMKKSDAAIIVAYTCGSDSGKPAFLRKIMGRKALFIKQRGADIGARMQNAISDALDLGYSKAVLIGTDIPEISSETINLSLTVLDDKDVVLGPTEDGGYYLIGMKAVHPEAFKVERYGGATVLEDTVRSLKNAGLSTVTVRTYGDMDIPEDLNGFRKRMRNDAHLRKSFTGRFLAGNARLSVIVPVYNEASVIRRMAEQLRPYRHDCEIIFVDGGSTDGTAEILTEIAESSGDLLILKEKKGRAFQMNAGAGAATGDILFFLHCDSILPERFVQDIRRVMAVYDWGCFRIKFRSSNIFMLTNRIVSNHRALCRKLPFGDQGIFIDRDLFFEKGCFPEIPLMEDYAFSSELRCRKGIKGPGLARGILISSARRYGKGTVSILRTEMQMWKLRHMYRQGISPWILQNYYDDIR